MRLIRQLLAIINEASASVLSTTEEKEMRMGYNNGFRGSFREKLIRFMAGRYGTDALYNFVLWVCVGLIIINIFVGSWIISIVETALFVWSIFRFMSRNIYKRQRENQIFLKISGKIKAPFAMLKNKWRDRKTHVYKRCPACKSTLRLPREKGKHSVRCPRCRELFDIKI